MSLLSQAQKVAEMPDSSSRQEQINQILDEVCFRPPRLIITKYWWRSEDAIDALCLLLPLLRRLYGPIRLEVAILSDKPLDAEVRRVVKVVKAKRVADDLQVCIRNETQGVAHILNENFSLRETANISEDGQLQAVARKPEQAVIAVPNRIYHGWELERDKNPKKFKGQMINRSGIRRNVYWNCKTQHFYEKVSNREIVNIEDIRAHIDGSAITDVGAAAIAGDALLQQVFNDNLIENHTGKHRPHRHTIRVTSSHYRSSY